MNPIWRIDCGDRWLDGAVRAFFNRDSSSKESGLLIFLDYSFGQREVRGKGPSATLFPRRPLDRYSHVSFESDGGSIFFLWGEAKKEKMERKYVVGRVQ